MFLKAYISSLWNGRKCLGVEGRDRAITSANSRMVVRRSCLAAVISYSIRPHPVAFTLMLEK